MCERDVDNGECIQDESDVPGGSLLSDMRTPAGALMDADEIDGPDGVLAEAEAWAPTPIELDNARLHDPASFDIITTLVDIYGDSLFVAEYKCCPTICCCAACLLPSAAWSLRAVPVYSRWPCLVRLYSAHDSRQL